MICYFFIYSEKYLILTFHFWFGSGFGILQIRTQKHKNTNRKSQIANRNFLISQDITVYGCVATRHTFPYRTVSTR